MIVQLGFAERELVEKAVEKGRAGGVPLGQSLIDAGIVDSNQLAQALAERNGLDYVDLNSFEVDHGAANLLDPAKARRYQTIPISFLGEQTMLVATADPANVLALDDISLEIGNGEFVCLVGASGCGKSTLLDIMAGLTKADAGRVLADGEPVVGPGRQRLVMFQEPALFPWLTAFGNVMFGLKLRHDLGNRERREIAWEHLVLVGLDEFAYANIHELSGGMKQRVA
ncbi:MAG: ATP-binding cassette domain-containing protein, partial [Burkholderiales bacterium]